MQKRLGFNIFRTEEATPTVLGVLGLKGALIKGLSPSLFSSSSLSFSKKLGTLKGVGGRPKSWLILPYTRLGPHKPSLSPYHPHIPLPSKDLYHVHSP